MAHYGISIVLLLTCSHKGYDLKHRHDSIQGTDYIANYFLNLRVSRAKI